MTTDNLKVKFHAKEIRRRLSTGKPPDSTFIQMLNMLSDQELVQREAAHHEGQLAALKAKVGASKKSAFDLLAERAARSAKILG